jgi:hypothetical protein
MHGGEMQSEIGFQPGRAVAGAAFGNDLAIPGGIEPVREHAVIAADFRQCIDRGGAYFQRRGGAQQRLHDRLPERHRQIMPVRLSRGLDIDADMKSAAMPLQHQVRAVRPAQRADRPAVQQRAIHHQPARGLADQCRKRPPQCGRPRLAEELFQVRAGMGDGRRPVGPHREQCAMRLNGARCFDRLLLAHRRIERCGGRRARGNIVGYIAHQGTATGSARHGANHASMARNVSRAPLSTSARSCGIVSPKRSSVARNVCHIGPSA